MKPYTTEIKWGILFTLMALLWMVIEKTMGWHDEKISQHATLTNIFAIPATALYVFALLDKRKRDLNGKMTWLQGFVSGLIISGVVAFLSPASQWVTHTLITPNYFPNMIAYAVASGNSTQEEAERFFSLSSYMMQGMIGAMIMGTVTAAIAAIFIKKR